MTTRMLIDAAHPEETRVVVVKGNRLDEFDFESSAKKQIKGNIYLARVTRIEPSLQAAFVEYGGNRHGFLAFNEIHPDYYQIPVADREALLAEEAEAVSIEDEPVDEDALEDALDFEAEVADTEEDTVSAAGADKEDGNSETNQAAAIETNSDGDGEEVTDTEASVGETSGDDDDDADDKGSTIAMSAGPIDSVRLENDGLDSGNPTVDEEPAIVIDPDATDGVVATTDIEDTATQNPVAAELPVADSDITDPEKTADADTKSVEDLTATPEDEETEIGDADLEVPDIDDNQKDEIGVTDIDDDTADIRRRRRTRSRRSYRIQEVIKKRQVLLVQVVKEERGNKGAALTTYLSLAGRYCVLMPNTARGGGISRKITSQTTRRKLKGTLSDLDVPKGMGVIVRTAGSERTKSEIKRDFDYLFRVWDNVRDLTLSSQAPTAVYEEANLIKRAIRDLYTKEIDEVLVEGEEGYKLAKSFMRMLMPSHAKKVQPYRDQVPLFHRYQVHQQLDSMHSSIVTLKSGGYLVLNPTEALVAVDVNSGKSTRGKNIEETALKTNLEAAEELARQLRLRDLAGLVVIDFIDMDEHRNNRAVERRFKDCIKGDRARTQVGRISNFGLLEMSRQRLRPSLQEAISIVCPHCEGSGYMRSTESSVLHVLRAIEEEGIRSRAAIIRAFVSAEVALHALNYKRQTLAEIEQRYQIEVMILADDKLISPNYRIEQEGTRDGNAVEAELVQVTVEPTEERSDGSGRKRRRRRRGKKDERGTNDIADSSAAGSTAEASTGGQTGPEAETTDSDDDSKSKRRRRGRRGGRNRKVTKSNNSGQSESGQSESGQNRGEAQNSIETTNGSGATGEIGENTVEPSQSGDGMAVAPTVGDDTVSESSKDGPKKPRRRRSPRKKSTAAKVEGKDENSVAADTGASPVVAEQVTEKVRKPAPKPDPIAKPEPAQPAEPKRKGWWQKAIRR